MTECILLLGDNLFSGLSHLPPNAVVFMREDLFLCTRMRHHKQKIVFFLSSMRHFRDELVASGRTVVYQELNVGSPSMNIFEAFSAFCAGAGTERVHLYEPNDAYFLPSLRESLAGVDLTVQDSPAFLTSKAEWQSYASSHRRRFMAEFYVSQRKRLNLLLDENGGPVAGKWSFDTENRKKLPSGLSVPRVWEVQPDGVTRKVIELVEKTFPNHPGSVESFGYAVCHRDAAELLEDFLSSRVREFGPYEDAIDTTERVLFHSQLSMYLNNGLLTPGQVIEAIYERHRHSSIPLASLEGLTRQIIGWREFVKGIDRDYADKGVGPSTENHFGHKRKLKSCWYDGNTGLLPLDDAIKRARDHGWCHHIERLMILGAAMLMCEIDPLETYNWFMEMFVDSADWVMLPNVIGMSQFADGGYFATKPYLSGSAYLLKMSNCPKGDWCEVWDGLFWSFLDRHRQKLSKNPRVSLMIKNLDRLSDARREKLFKIAEQFRNRVTTEVS